MKSYTDSIRSHLPLPALATLALLAAAVPAAADVPGGFLEQPLTAQIRPRLTAAQIQGFLPARGAFTFPAPYNTQGVRITNASDCGGADCVYAVGYSYYRNINNHVGSDTMYVFLGLDQNRGGGGPTLFSYNKVTEEVRNLGALFDTGSALSWGSGEGWYFSATLPTKLYVNDGPRMRRYDVLSKQFETVFDITARFGAGHDIWQMHSSDDDRVHSATLRNTSTWEYLGCVVYHENTAQLQYFPRVGDFNECHVDKSGRWLMSQENTTGLYGLDMRIFDLATGVERRVLDPSGAVGHADMGYGYVIGSDNWYHLSNANFVWDFANNPLSGSLVSYNTSFAAPAPNHVSHTNARAGVPIDQQYACGSGASSADAPWANEVICFRLDGSLNVLVAAPVMTDMNSGVGGDDYAKQPKGNLDVTGQYFVWTSNAGGSRVDAFIAKVPGQLLGGDGTGPGPDITAPTVTITAPADGSTVSGSVTLSAAASDNTGVAGVQFQLDGLNLGAEDSAAPYSITWNTASTPSGVHTLTAVARDAAGNSGISNPVIVTLGGDVTAPAISAIVSSNISPSGATVTWNTGESSDSQVEYGPTSAYGSATTLNTNLVTAHAATLGGLTPDTQYHYRVKSRDVAGNLAVSGDTTFTTATAATGSGPQNVVWTGTVNVTATGNSLKKTGGCDGCEDAGAVSEQQIGSGNGYMEFTVSETDLVRYIGLTNNNTGTSTGEIPFAFKLVSGYAEVRESGVYRWDAPVVTGDVLRIAVQSGAVKYSKNGVVFYTSTVTPSYPLRADSALTSSSATVSSAVILATP